MNITHKICNKHLQSGRSMIEMLGVLAIIGVLSVGGIMGYSKAMLRYKINKYIEQITYIAGNVRTTFANQGNYEGLTTGNNEGCALLKKAHIFPEDMKMFDDGCPQSLWGDQFDIHSEKKNSADTQWNKAFSISDLSDNIPEEVCIELLTHDWKNAQVKMISIFNGMNSITSNFYIIPPAKLDDAVKICDQSDTTNNPDYDFYFYFDVDTSDSYWKVYHLDITTSDLAGN